MKRSLFLLMILSVLCITGRSSAQSRPFGAGIILGEPAGISLKLWTAPETALDFGIGWSIGGDRIGQYDSYYYGDSRTHIHADYLWHSFDVIHASDRYPVYYGIGARINSGSHIQSSFAVRGVLGIAWMPRSTPIDVFMEIVPMIQLTSSSGVGVEAGVGIRYYF